MINFDDIWLKCSED